MVVVSTENRRNCNHGATLQHLLRQRNRFFTAAACPAMAGVYYETYTGTASGVDSNGLFGTAGATLNNVTYTSTYAYNPSQLGSAYFSSQAGLTYMYGGSSNATYTTDPFLSASLTINGNTYNQTTPYSGFAQLSNNSGNTSLYSMAKASASNYIFDTAFPVTVVTPSFTTLQSFALPSGTGSGSFNYNGESLSLTETYFALTSAPTPVSEPASLALLAGAAGIFAAALGTGRSASSRRLEVVGRQAVA